LNSQFPCAGSSVTRWTSRSAASSMARPRCSRASVVLEVVEDDGDGTYRAVYTVRFREAVFVLHVFQKKSKRGIATPQADMEVIRQRLKVAAIVAQELKDEEASR